MEAHSAHHPTPFSLSAIRLMAVRVSRAFAVPPARLFAAWLDSQTRERFLPIVCGPGAQIRYVEIDRPHRLAFDLQRAGRSGLPDRVTFELAPLEGGALLVLIHELSNSGTPDTASVKAAWNKALGVLEATLAAA